MLWTLIAVKPFDEAKTRLAPVLRPAQRFALAQAMLARTVRVVRTAVNDGPIIIVSYPGIGEQAAAAVGADRLFLSTQGGLNAQLADASTIVPATDPLLVLHADLPLLARDDIAAMQMSDKPIVMAPDRRQSGTNALLQTSGPRFFRFGNASFALHCAAAQLRATPWAVIRRYGLAFDLDEPADLDDLYREVSQAATDRSDDDNFDRLLWRIGFPTRDLTRATHTT